MKNRIRSILVSLALCLPIASQADSETGSLPENANYAPADSSGIEPKNFGTADWIIDWLPAASFIPRDSSATTSYSGTGRIHNSGASSIMMWAPVDLPHGALLDIMRLYVCDDDASLDATMWLSYFDGASTLGVVDVNNVSSSGNPGCTTYSLTGMNHTINIGLNSNHRSYVVYVRLPASSAVSFKGVRLAWFRQVSPAPATATFDDVSTGHQFFQYIEALAESGITSGCDATSFCPDAPVTRGQMAVFLSKALGLHYGWSQ